MPPRKLTLAPTLSLPLDAVTRTFGIFGQRGSGKSTTGASLVEQIVEAGGRSLVLDPTGVWWGLTREGSGPGLPGVVLGGEHADAPLEPGSGSLVAEFVLGTEYPLVVLDMKLLRKGQRQHLAMELLEALYHDNRDPLMVVLDEAPQFAPQMMRGKGEDAVVPRLLGAAEDVVSLGRSRGLGATLIAQRLAMVNTNVREQVETLVSHRLMGTNDRKALKGWIEAQADPAREGEVMSHIAKLPDGSALVWSPTFLDFFGVVAMNNATTFDSRATPKVGQRVKKPGKRAPVDLATLRERMAETIKEAQERDPTELRKRLRKAEQLAVGAKEMEEMLDAVREAFNVQGENAPEWLVNIYQGVANALELPWSADVVDEVRALATGRPILGDDDLAKLRTLSAHFEEGQGSIVRAYEALREVLDPLAANVREELQRRQLQAARPVAPPRQSTTSQRPPQPSAVRPPARASAAAPEAAVEPGASNGAGITGVQQRILDAIAWWQSVGQPEPQIPRVAFVVGYHTRSKSFTNALSGLSSGGYIERGTGTVKLTDTGLEHAHVPPGVLDDAALQNRIIEKLSPLNGRLLRFILDHPGGVPTETIAEAFDYHPRSKSFTNGLSRLSGLGLIDRDRGSVKPSEFCYVGSEFVYR